jgi:hypothetical protein
MMRSFILNSSTHFPQQLSSFVRNRNSLFSRPPSPKLSFLLFTHLDSTLTSTNTLAYHILSCSSVTELAYNGLVVVVLVVFTVVMKVWRKQKLSPALARSPQSHPFTLSPRFTRRFRFFHEQIIESLVDFFPIS